MKLGINVDHVATLREARGAAYPDPVVAAMLSDHAGCDSIVMHLREDRRHIKERDISLIKGAIKIPFNLEMSINEEIIDIALGVKPQQVTLVPEKREELTTEGGLNILKDYGKIEKAVRKLQEAGIQVSLFISPLQKHIREAKRMGVNIVEINTGMFSEAKTPKFREKELKKVEEAAKFAKSLGFFVAAGHGIDYENVKKIVTIKEIEELNIGHSVICRSIFIGIISAVEEMLDLIQIKGRKTKE